MTGGGTAPLLLLVSPLAHLSLCQDILVQRHCRVLFSAAELAGRALVFCSADYLELLILSWRENSLQLMLMCGCFVAVIRVYNLRGSRYFRCFAGLSESQHRS